MAEEGKDTRNGGESSSDELPEMKPVGYFEGESMTRRKVFAVAGQALGDSEYAKRSGFSDAPNVIPSASIE